MGDSIESPSQRHIKQGKGPKNSVHFQDISQIHKKDRSKILQNDTDKFKYLFQIPNIISDPKLVQRRKTFETFTKNANLDLYYMHLKKASGIARSISQKADYKEVIAKIHNNKMQDQFVHKLHKNKGFILTNELWSNKLVSQVSDQSRLKELSQMLQLQKIKLNSEEQLQNYEQYFKQFVKSKCQNEMEVRRGEVSKAFNDLDDQATLDQTYKDSRVLSRNQSVPMKQTDQSFFSREIMTAQVSKKRGVNSQHSSIKLAELLKQSNDEIHSTQEVVIKLRRFTREEADLQDKPKKIRIRRLFAEQLNNVIKNSKKIN
ncbi:unnamed protein product (macronuclear) [Paramecium tetraurelia]|uniref:Uncharacterized protein n=1 Tax=Paramecium tetraurelia TaxID=5888 RepID=A0EAC0_PARTE|nr:uncharacterized protein GSPATT00024969001 [Paramecium tetraurelia]CAK92237.1 unnamed protein product [Paramecium tetraurelia]|eukprot:XP_001459634.1 hypothetical protein (macronuclear) [Paramecium tetraurelia strain d4-2]